MKKNSLAIALLAAILGVSSVTVVSNMIAPNVAYAQDKKEAVKEATKDVIREAWVKPYKEAHNAIAAKEFDTALAKIKEMEASDNQTNYEKFIAANSRMEVGRVSGNNGLLLQGLEGMIHSNYLPAAEQLKFLEVLAGVNYTDKKYKESQKWVEKYMAMDNSKPVMQDLYIQNYYLIDDFANAKRAAKEQIERDLAAKKTPSETRLRMLHGASMKVNDVDTSTYALELLANYYPSKEYWADVIYRLPAKKTFNDRYRLDFYRLLMATGNIESGDQYGEMMELSLATGLPADAKQAAEEGYRLGLLGKGVNAAKHKQLSDKAHKQFANDAKNLDQDVATSKTGLAMVNMGYTLVTNNQVERGIALMEQGIAKGGLKSVDEAKLHLGMAYLKAGNRVKAEEVLNSVQGNDGARDIARYWLMLKDFKKN